MIYNAATQFYLFNKGVGYSQILFLFMALHFWKQPILLKSNECYIAFLVNKG